MLTEILICFLLSAIPGLYAASRRYFIIIANPKHDSFLLRAAYAVPPLSMCSCFMALLVFVLYQLGRSIYGLDADYWSSEVYIYSFAVAALLVVLVCRFVLMSRSVPPEFRDDFMTHDFYVFLPDPDSRTPMIYQPPMPRKPSLQEAWIRNSVYTRTDLRFLDKNGKNIISSSYGQFFISEKARTLFDENGLTGFQIRSLMDTRPRPYQPEKKYFHLSVSSVLPPVSSQKGNMLIYDSSVKDIICDFNLTDEEIYFSSQQHCHIMIVSKKAAEIMMDQLHSPKRFFLPVSFIDPEQES
ncbi:hypothetical protein J5839_03610 [Methanosarcinaceae archaeon]|nr:hypothetical protein [Methanosarcinaceae archaeon]